MARLALIIAVAIASGCSSTGWRSQTIDGSSQSAFEESVVLLQQKLPPRRRAEFETSLAVIWMRDVTVGAGDLDSDGRVDVAEARHLMEAAETTLTDIRRGVFISALEGRSENADRYVRQLGGLNYHDVIEHAALTSGDVFIDAARRQQAQVRCNGWRQLPKAMKAPVLSRYCRRHL